MISLKIKIYYTVYIYIIGILETTSVVDGNNDLSGNSPPLPNGPAPSQPLPPQFDNDDIDKLPPLPPGSPPSVCDVPLRKYNLLFA